MIVNILFRLHTLIILCSICSVSFGLPCICDTSTMQTNPPDICNYTKSGTVIAMTGCDCKTTTDLLAANTTASPTVIYCVPDPNAVTTTTVATTTTTLGCTDANQNGICDNLEVAADLRCYKKTMTSSLKNIAKYLIIIGAVWVIIWCFVTIVINFMHKNKGHHRWIHLYEELVIIALMVVAGILNLLMVEKEGACRIIAILIHFFMVMATASFVMEAFFANSMVHGGPKKNGCIPVFLNYIVPIVLALIPTLVTYFSEKDIYGKSMLHCFASLTQHQMWGFVIPVWILSAVAAYKAQMACLACNMTNEEQDEAQCFWAKRSAKVLSLVVFFLLTIWLGIMHAGDQQLFYLFILTFIVCLFFGPLLFVAHTYCHKNTCNRWGKPGCFGRMYMLCPESEKKTEYIEKIVYVDKPVEKNDLFADEEDSSLKKRRPTMTDPYSPPMPVGLYHIYHPPPQFHMRRRAIRRNSYGGATLLFMAN